MGAVREDRQDRAAVAGAERHPSARLWRHVGHRPERLPPPRERAAGLHGAEPAGRLPHCRHAKGRAASVAAGARCLRCRLERLKARGTPAHRLPQRQLSTDAMHVFPTPDGDDRAVAGGSRTISPSGNRSLRSLLPSGAQDGALSSTPTGTAHRGSLPNGPRRSGTERRGGRSVWQAWSVETNRKANGRRKAAHSITMAWSPADGAAARRSSNSRGIAASERIIINLKSSI